jgi:hypothetical protein
MDMTLKSNNIKENEMTRLEFLKKAGFIAAGLAVAAKLGNVQAIASPIKETKVENGQEVGPVAPKDTGKTWIDTSVGGVQKYWNGNEWTPVKATWG